jgi:hypothetical protein
MKALTLLESAKLPDSLSQYEEVKHQIVDELKSDPEKPSMSYIEKVRFRVGFTLTRETKNSSTIVALLANNDYSWRQILCLQSLEFFFL